MVAAGLGPHAPAGLELAHAVLQHGDAEDQVVRHHSWPWWRAR